MIRKILLAAVILVAGFSVIVAMQPTDYRVERSVLIRSTPAVIFPHINELKRWNDWSPWAKLDPQMKNTFEGPEAGQGAVFCWAGNHQVGEGRMTILESQPNERIRLQLEFIKPMAGVSTTEFTFRPEGNQTKVTWTMTGKNDFVGKAMCVFMNMDRMVGGQFEQGLAAIKSLAEASSPAELSAH